MLVSCLAYSSTLKMEAIRPSETSDDFHRITRRFISEDKTLHSDRCENLQSNLSQSTALFLLKEKDSLT
jgi:hypothetical protein